MAGTITEERTFAQQNRASPLGLTRVCRLGLNGEHLGLGRWGKRRGISTDLTVNMQIGSEAPFSFLVWKIGSTYYRVAVGNDAAVVYSPWSNYLYELSVDHAAGAIWSGPDTNIDTFGLDAPTQDDPMKTVIKDATEPWTGFAGGFYIARACSYNALRRCKSPALEVPAWNDASGYTAQDAKVARIMGSVQYVEMPEVAIDALADKARWYRARVISLDTGSFIGGKGENELRFVKENDGSAWTDYGIQDYSGVSELWDFATDPIPPCDKGIWFDGRAFWLKGAATGCHHFLYWSNPACPETTGLNNYAISYDDGRGVQAGEFMLAVPVHCGVPIGLVARGEILLVLCQFGAWRVHRHPALEGVYVIEQDNQWVGCVSAATIAYGPEGAYWLSHQGVVVWDGATKPFILTEAMLDTTDSDTAFADDLSEACGAYDQDRRLYICVVPKSGGGQFGICVHGRPPPNELQYGTWTFGDNLPTITGMGYDWHTRQMIYGFGTETVTAKTQADGVYLDNDPATGDTYEYAAEVWSGELPARGEDKNGLGCRVFLNRPDTSVEQSVDVYMDVLRTTEEAAFGTPETLTWVAGETKPKLCVHEGDFGRLLRVRVSNEDAYGLEIDAIQIGSPDEIREAHGAV